MFIVITDVEVIGEVTSQAFQIYQQGPVNSLVTLKNAGVNPIVYVFQQLEFGVWTDIDVLGTPFNDTLDADDAIDVQINVTSNRVRLQSNASGSSTLSFNVLLWVDRAAGGALPILNF